MSILYLTVYSLGVTLHAKQSQFINYHHWQKETALLLKVYLTILWALTSAWDNSSWVTISVCPSRLAHIRGVASFSWKRWQWIVEIDASVIRGQVQVGELIAAWVCEYLLLNCMTSCVGWIEHSMLHVCEQLNGQSLYYSSASDWSINTSTGAWKALESSRHLYRLGHDRKWLGQEVNLTAHGYHSPGSQPGCHIWCFCPCSS